MIKRMSDMLTKKRLVKQMWMLDGAGIFFKTDEAMQTWDYLYAKAKQDRPKLTVVEFYEEIVYGKR
jgi:hypothetical protein